MTINQSDNQIRSIRTMAAPALPDRRRVVGPAETFVPELATSEAPLPLTDKRADGRGFDTLRSICASRFILVTFTLGLPCASDASAGVIEHARGSFYMEVGSTKVMCAVYGPRPPQRPRFFSEQGMLDCCVTWAPFASARRKLGFKDSDEQALAATIESALVDSVRLDEYPKLSVDLYVTVLEDGGAVEAAAITCAAGALAHAGIALYDTVVASSAGIVQDRILMDCDANEQKRVQGSLLVSMMPSINETTYVDSRGEVDWNTLIEATEMCLDACIRTRKIIDEALVAAL